MIVEELFGCTVYDGEGSLRFQRRRSTNHFALVQVKVLKLHSKEIGVVHHLILFGSTFGEVRLYRILVVYDLRPLTKD